MQPGPGSSQVACRSSAEPRSGPSWLWNQEARGPRCCGKEVFLPLGKLTNLRAKLCPRTVCNLRLFPDAFPHGVEWFFPLFERQCEVEVAERQRERVFHSWFTGWARLQQDQAWHPGFPGDSRGHHCCPQPHQQEAGPEGSILL